ncbi:hypothetical protein LCGC14_2994740 [marine sediment metagenome]|uniref:Uncharacterized protein n=1 Tax=marine sediment metagenome TaxID=412755 RepID=A0A0F8X3B0_9ZZZZ
MDQLEERIRKVILKVIVETVLMAVIIVAMFYLATVLL